MGRYSAVGSFINNEPVLIAFARKHRVTFIKNTRKTHLRKLADFQLQTDLCKKLICPATARKVENEAGGEQAPAQRVLHPTATHSGAAATLGPCHGHISTLSPTGKP